MKKLLALMLAMVMTLALFAGCSKKEEEKEEESKAPVEEKEEAEEEKEEEKADPIKVALIASSSGLGDRSFNDAAWEGFGRAEADFGVEIKVVEPNNVADYQSTAASLANAGYKFIFATGNDWGDTLTEVAPQYPDVYFAGLNVNATGENVGVAQTADNEIGFLVGALAAMMSETGTVGYIGGMEVPSQVRFNVGYSEGVAYVNAEAKVLSTYVGAFNDPTKGKEFALELIGQGADVIFHTAGKSGEGLFEAIKENEGVYAIGVDSNQDYIVEGKVLTTAEKRLGNIAYDMISRIVDGTFETGKIIYNLENGGVGLTEMEFTKDLIGEENIAKLAELEAGIVDGSITVTDTYDAQ